MRSPRVCREEPSSYWPQAHPSDLPPPCPPAPRRLIVLDLSMMRTEDAGGDTPLPSAKPSSRPAASRLRCPETEAPPTEPQGPSKDSHRTVHLASWNPRKGELPLCSEFMQCGGAPRSPSATAAVLGRRPLPPHRKVDTGRTAGWGRGLELDLQCGPTEGRAPTKNVCMHVHTHAYTCTYVCIRPSARHCRSQAVRCCKGQRSA